MVINKAGVNVTLEDIEGKSKTFIIPEHTLSMIGSLAGVKPIQAIKWLRVEYGIGLVQAKGIVDYVKANRMD